MARRDYFWLEMAQYVGLALAALIGLPELYLSGRRWWVAIGLLVGLGLVYYHWPRRRYHIYLAVESVLVTGLIVYHPMFMILGFTFSAHAMILFPDRRGAVWIGAMALATWGVMVYEEGWISGTMAALGIGVGYGSFGFANYARVRAEAARRESKQLLLDLQEAHNQLKVYAEQVEELAIARERNRLAREMHDTLGHRLTVAAVQLEGAQRLIADDPERASHMVGTVRDQVRDALQELRRAVATLRTPLEADLSLPQALARLVHSFEEATGLNLHLALLDGVPAFPAAYRLTIYRAVQEALTNVQRHARAQNVWLRLSIADGVVVLSVEDDGVGPPGSFDQARFGLRGMRERAGHLGGTLALEPRAVEGTRLVLRLPWPQESGNDG